MIMKKRIYKMLTLIILTIFISSINIVNAKDTVLTFSHNNFYEVSNIYNVLGNKDGYIFLEENYDYTNIYSYDNSNTMKSAKKFEDLTNTKIIKYNDYYLVAGINNNVLKVYLIDNNLQIHNQEKTTYILDNSATINLYNYNNKIYLMITEDEILSSTNIYEIDENLNVSEISFSSLGSDNIKGILKGDYYLIHFNSEINNTSEKENHYYESTYLEDKYIIVGTNYNSFYNEENSNDYKGILTIIDKDGNLITNEINEDYSFYSNIQVVKDKLIVLAHTEYYENSYILTYDFNGNLISEEILDVDEGSQIYKMYKVGNNIVFSAFRRPKTIAFTSNLLFYSFNLNIIKEDNAFGTIEIPETSTPYSKVSFNVVPNSGYEVDNIIVKDSQGEIIKISNNSFIMPENDVIIKINYKEIISNPETIDYIILISLSLLLITIVTIKLYKKMSWLK